MKSLRYLPFRKTLVPCMSVPEFRVHLVVDILFVCTGCAGRGELVFVLDAVPTYEQYRIQQVFVKDLLSLLDCIREGATRVGYVSVSDTETRSFSLGVFHQPIDISAAIGKDCKIPTYIYSVLCLPYRQSRYAFII